MHTSCSVGASIIHVEINANNVVQDTNRSNGGRQRIIIPLFASVSNIPMLKASFPTFYSALVNEFYDAPFQRAIALAIVMNVNIRKKWKGIDCL